MKPGLKSTLLLALAAIILATTANLWVARLLPVQNASGKADIHADFDLTDSEGTRRTHSDFAGKFLLVYFGYTACPDMCPTGLALMSEAKAQLPEIPLQPLFISIDPERDTRAVLKDYAANFPGIIAMSGSSEQIKNATRAFRVAYMKGPVKADGSYLMDHSTLIYLMDRQGNYLAHFPQNTPLESLKRGIRDAINASQPE